MKSTASSGRLYDSGLLLVFPVLRVRDVAWLGAGVWSHFASSSVSRCESASPCILSALKPNTFIPMCHGVDFQSSIPSLSLSLRIPPSTKPHSSTQLVRCLFHIEDGSHFFLPLTFVLDHSGYHQPHCYPLQPYFIPRVDSHILALDLYRGLWYLGVQHKMVVAVRAVFVPVADQPYTPLQLALNTHASSNSRASFRNAFLHFLQMKVMSKVCVSA
jgi:hypothetical protein